MFHPCHPTRQFCVTSLLMLAILAYSHAAQANPSNKDFDDGFSVHGKDYSATLVKQAHALYEKANAEVIAFTKIARSNRGVRRLNWKPLGQNEVRLFQLIRVADQLELLGETAGVDYRLRANSLLATNGDIIDAFRSTDEAQKQMAKVRLTISRLAQARRREIEKLTKMAIEKKWEAAETALYKYLDSLGIGTACLFNPEKPPIYAPFAEVQSVIDSSMRRIRMVKAKQLLTQRRLAETPDFDGILREAREAAVSLATSGIVSIDGAKITGPEALTKFGERWAEAQVKTIRCRTLDWLLSNYNDMDAMLANGSSGGGENPNKHKIIQEFAKFNNAMMQSLAGLIEADAKRVTGADAVRLYSEYLQACAPLIRRSADRSLAPVINPALQALARRAPQFPLEISAYAEGTDDLLRWRGRVAHNRAVVRAADFPLIDRLMFETTLSDSDYKGLYPLPQLKPDPKVASLLASAPEVMPRPIERLQGRRAQALDVVRLGKNRPAAIARYRVRSYANIPAPLDLAAETDSLKFDLMVDENLPPISISAAVAVDSAERGDLVAVGGTIRDQYLESVMTRFAALPTAASVISALGRIPQERYNYGNLDQVLMRFDLTPSWAQHDFFFVEFSPPETPTE